MHAYIYIYIYIYIHTYTSGVGKAGLRNRHPDKTGPDPGSFELFKGASRIT